MAGCSPPWRSSTSTPRQWTESEITLVQEVVERCWSIIERARAELVVRESEEHLRLVIAASNDGIFEHDFITEVIVLVGSHV